jgi:hypothetical protein
VPHTPQWFDYWTEKLDELMNGEPVDEKLPIDFLDGLIARTDAAPAVPPSKHASLFATFG